MIRQSAIYLFARLFQAGVTISAVALYTRLLSPEAYGTYSLTIAATMVAYGLSINWVSTSALRLYDGAKNKSEFQATILIIYAGAVTCTVGFCIGYWAIAGRQIEFEFLLLGILLFGTISWLELNYSLLGARLEAGRFASINVARTLLATIGGTLLAYLGYGASGVLLGSALGMILPSIYLVRTDWREIRLLGSNRQTLRTILSYGLPLAIGLALHSLAINSDRLLLGTLASAYTVGLYAVAFELADRTISAFMSAVASVAYPRAVRELEKSGRDAADKQLRQNIVLLTGIGLPVAVGISAIAPTVATVLVGPAFRETASWLIPILALAAFMNGLRGYYFDHAFQLAQKPSHLILVMLSIAGTNIGLNLLLIPRFGLLGAACTLVTAHVVGLMFCVILGRRSYHMPFPASQIAKIVLAALVMGSLVHEVSAGSGLLLLVLQLGVGVLAYSTLLVLLNIGSLRIMLISFRHRKDE